MMTEGSKHIDGLTASEKAVMDAIIAEHGPHLQRFLASRVSELTDREDIEQETYLRLLKYDNLDTVSNLRAFLFRIAENILKDRGRRNAFRQEDKHIPVEDAVLADPAPSQDHIIQGDESLALFKHSLQSMPAKQRQAFLLSRMDEMNYRDIARHMGVSVKSVEKYISDALAHIRKKLGYEGGRASLGKGTRK